MKKAVLFGLVTLSTCAYAQKSITGFTPSNAEKELKTEQSFDNSLDARYIGETIKDLSAIPHNLSSPGDKVVADKILARYKSYGLDAHIETYWVLYPTPKTRVLELTKPVHYTTILKEPAIAQDATSGQTGQLPTTNAWSADGDVTGQLVFVNYGLPEDYDRLTRMGISVKGKIVIAKYGKSWRGIKPKVAYEHGAIGCIIYSDPKDDGYLQGDVYPKGPFKNEYGVQRGSVMDMVIYPGDPLTPGIGATKNAKRLDRKDAITILKIPVLPISYHDAKPLLASITGPVAPAEWQGGLPITYHVGPGSAVVHLKLNFNWNIVPAYDVIATIKGTEFPDEWVMRGNHHDAWVNGANDPISGQSAMLDEAKALGELLKTGWRPKRTIVYCSWDGEEPGLLGSTEYLEDHMKELQQKAVVYINSDGNARGFLDAGGSHALEHFMTEVSQSVIDPQTDVSVYERKRAHELLGATTDTAKKELLKRKVERLSALGSGSDYSSFLQHAGITTLDLGFGGEDAGGEYHSIYDSYDMYRRFKDPGFVYSKALAGVAGHAVLRMADADMLPFNFTYLYETINRYAKELEDMTKEMRAKTELDNQLIEGGVYKLADDPQKNLKSPEVKSEVPKLDFSALKSALDSLKHSAAKMNSDWELAMNNGGDQHQLNEKLYQAEEQLLAPEGLPRRPWYRHTIYAPGFYTGYGVKTMPGIREAIEQRNWKEAQTQIDIDARAITALATYLEK